MSESIACEIRAGNGRRDACPGHRIPRPPTLPNLTGCRAEPTFVEAYESRPVSVIDDLHLPPS